MVRVGRSSTTEASLADTMLEIRSGARALLGRFELRLRRGKIGTGENSGGKSATGRLVQAHRKIAEKNQALKKIRRRVTRRDREIARLRAALIKRGDGQTGGIGAENIVWIFGAGRTGSTWLAAMMEEMEGQAVWFEPWVGILFGDFYYERSKRRAVTMGKHFILGEACKDTWLDSVRTLVLGEANARFPEAAYPGGYLVVKEPNGSIGAPLLMEALPESRMILLVRDPRDVVASNMDSFRKGGWQYEERKDQEREVLLDAINADPDAYAKTLANIYLQDVGNAKEAYDAHVGYKVLVKYEDLRANALATMRRIYSALDLPVEEDALARAVEKHAWERIPEEEKGEGKFYRKATPGGWREDLTPGQVETVERITAPLLEELYPDDAPRRSAS